MPSKTVESVGLKIKRWPPAPRPQYEHIVETFDFQFNEKGQVEVVSTGKVDTFKEVQSHKDEVGLVNRMRLAAAQGLGLDAFAKTEPGLMVDLSGIDTVDDLMKAQADNAKKLDDMAKQLGISTAELVAAVKAGDMSVFEPKTEATKTEATGGAE